MKALKGLHHVTAVSKDPQVNTDFYQQVLGQRLVKQTVNFDDPFTYHLYYGDRTGTPGHILTFFPYLHMKKGRRGTGETASTAYSIKHDSLEYWMERLEYFNVPGLITQERFGDTVLAFHDPHGMNLELITMHETPDVNPWEDGPIETQDILAGFHSVTLWVSEPDRTARLLQDYLGYRFYGQDGQRYRFQADLDSPGHTLDLLHRPGYPGALFGAGSVHHIAFRADDENQQLAYQEALRSAGFRVTPVQDRQYFRSIYFREPNGVLFEIATDAPGFLYDETDAELGSSLKLPPWLEDRRGEIISGLPAIEQKLNVVSAR